MADVPTRFYRIIYKETKTIKIVRLKFKTSISFCLIKYNRAQNNLLLFDLLR